MKIVEIGLLLTIVLPILVCVGVESLFPNDLVARSDLIVLSEVAIDHEQASHKIVEVWKGKAIPPLQLGGDRSTTGQRFVLFVARRGGEEYSWIILGISPISNGQVLFQGGLSQGQSNATVKRVTSFSIEDFKSLIIKAVNQPSQTGKPEPDR